MPAGIPLILQERLEHRVGLVKHRSITLLPDSCHCLHPQIKLKYFFKLAAEKTSCMKDKVLLKYILKKSFFLCIAYALNQQTLAF